jgi:regulator of sirC expression with transglutaminase-like and TPR domain
MDFPRARQLFYQEIHQPDADLNLERAALYLAQEEYPDLEVDQYLGKMDAIATAVQTQLPQNPYPLKIIQTLNKYLYGELKFAGNTTDYYDPRNSFLNEVLDRRTGIPITLALVYLAIARRLDFPMVGIGMPGHFLMRPIGGDLEIFVDAFNGGEVLFIQDCHDRLNQLYGSTVEFLPQFLEPVTAQQFLARMLTNLKMIYLRRGDVLRGLAAIERILLLFPQTPLELRDRGVLYYRLSRLTAARQDLETYLALLPSATDVRAVRQLLHKINHS